ncbi:hypothetical protein [Streptomyces griseocarneus]|uniref:hypothetical protein n=1 Tax=Streptomyces griseocarneus TaxID=51201 RepID=UPI00167E2A33|nr:hypothetical protein [Streptomyces griseocarneus]MBZ6475967.1 hypothetical protein [Streptomyces griseocarneus]GHG49785.1 hypothetical protein GCM10018779_09230 [Streptomyces griseocarneus]
MRIDPARALGAYVRAEAYRAHRPDPEPEPAPVIVEERPEAPASEAGAHRPPPRRPGVLARLLFLRQK